MTVPLLDKRNSDQKLVKGLLRSKACKEGESQPQCSCIPDEQIHDLTGTSKTDLKHDVSLLQALPVGCVPPRDVSSAGCSSTGP